MALPGTTLGEEFRRCNVTINAAVAYCKFQEGGAAAARSMGSSLLQGWPFAQDAFPQLAAAAAERQALSAAMLSVFTDKRPTVCFLCLGE
jgi:hypothetical protein